MNFFNKKYTSLLSIALVGIVASACSDDKKGGDDPVPTGNLVTIETEVYTKSATPTLELKDGATMNVYIKNGTQIGAPDYMPAVKATNSGGQWTTNPEIRLPEGKTVCLYAVAPYSEANTDPKAIAIDTKDQIDVLYSGDYVPVSSQTTHAKFRMKHALSLMSFNISYSGSGDAGTLTSISVAGQNVYTTGTLNVETGKITTTGNTQVTVATNNKIQASGWTKDLPGIWVIPFESADNAVNLTANIDGKTYVAIVPSVNIKQGFRYVFHLVLTPNGLVFDPSATEEISLNVFDDTMRPMEGYGALKFGFTGTDFSYPFFDGNEVFGNVKSGSAQANFTTGGKFTVPGSGNREVIVETWNSQGFELPNLEGIESIDISAY